MRARAWTAAVAGLSLLAGCAAGRTRANLFSTDWSDDGGRSIDEVRRRLGDARFPRGADVAIGISGHGQKVIGLPLSPRSKPWVRDEEVTSRPVIAGTVVVLAGPRDVAAVDAVSGNTLWRRATGGLFLRGASDDGSVTVMTFAQGGGRGSVLLAVLRDGTSVRQIEDDRTLGAPAVIQGFAFVPWDGKYVSALDLSDGMEAGRVTLGETTSRAWVSGGALYLGELGFYRFDEHLRDASRGQATHFVLPSRDYPAAAVLTTSGYDRALPAAKTRDGVRLYARPDGNAVGPAGGGSAPFSDGRYYATYRRASMGFEAESGALAWVHLGDAAVVGAAAANGGLLTCDENGKLAFLDARSGAATLELDLGSHVDGCVVQVESLRAPATTAEALPVVQQLASAIDVSDPTLLPAQRWFLRELGRLPGDAATRALSALATEERLTARPELHAEAAAVLASRRDGPDTLLGPLAHPYDFLKGVLSPPPVGVLARALAAMKSDRAARALAPYLLDPSCGEADVRQVALALRTLADPAALPWMRPFFAMYRGAADTEAMVEAVAAIGDGLGSFGTAQDRAAVEHAAADPMTVPAIRERLTPHRR